VAVDRHQFWQKVTDIDSDDKLRALSRQLLRDYEKYFVEVQYDPTLPPHERNAAQNHLTRIHREIASSIPRRNSVVSKSTVIKNLEGSEPLSAYAPARLRSGDRQLVRRDLVS